MAFVFILVYVALITPFTACFDKIDNSVLFLVERIIDICFFIDIVFTFFRAIKEGQFIITDRKKIAK